jgi:hypothetical protein
VRVKGNTGFPRDFRRFKPSNPCPVKMGEGNTMGFTEDIIAIFASLAMTW